MQGCLVRVKGGLVDRCMVGRAEADGADLGRVGLGPAVHEHLREYEVLAFVKQLVVDTLLAQHVAVPVPVDDGSDAAQGEGVGISPPPRIRAGAGEMRAGQRQRRRRPGGKHHGARGDRNVEFSHCRGTRGLPYKCFHRRQGRVGVTV